MENIIGEQGEKDTVLSKCELTVPRENMFSPSPAVKKSPKFGNFNEEFQFSTKTPEKVNRSLPTNVDEGEYKVPTRFTPLVELFDGMVCSLGLLRLRNKSPTFQNISTQVSVLTKRRLSCIELARMKYLLPEVIQIQKTLVHDQKSLCMKADMKISLFSDHVASSTGTSDYSTLHNIFVSQLVSFSEMHPKADNVPLAPLPHPFGNVAQHSEAQEIAITPSEYQPNVDYEFAQLPIVAQDERSVSASSHFAPSFTRRFSKNAIVGEDKSKKVSCELNAAAKEVREIYGSALNRLDLPDVQLNNQAENCSAAYSAVVKSPSPTISSSIDDFGTRTPALSPAMHKPGFRSSVDKNDASTTLPVKRSLEFFDDHS